METRIVEQNEEKIVFIEGRVDTVTSADLAATVSPITPGLKRDAKTARNESKTNTASEILRVFSITENNFSSCAFWDTKAITAQYPSLPEIGSRFTNAKNRLQREKYKT